VLNQKIEHTNICVLSCKFCDFAVKKGDASAYEIGQVIDVTPDITGAHHRGKRDWPGEQIRPSSRHDISRTRRKGVHGSGD
jgi:hypothetical protein